MIKNLLREENKNIIFLFLFISLIVVCLPRFDRADYGPVKKFVGNEELYEGLPYDILIYKNYIEYLRTGEGIDKVHPPYSYRILVPLLASYLPFAPLTSLNLINFVFLVIGLIFLYKTLAKLGLKFEYRIIGCLLYIFSFPMFYYATSGYIDGTFVGIEMAAVYFIVSRSWIKLFITVLAGTLANEKMIILFPFLAAFLYAEKINFRLSLILTAIFLFTYISVSYALREFSPSSAQGYVWFPESKFIMQNIFRPKTYLSFLIAFGIPGILALISYFKLPAEKLKLFSYFYAGCLTSILLYLYSFFSAWADGRTVWTIYPFAIPLAVIYLQNRSHDS